MSQLKETSHQTSWLLRAGVVAGPLFVAVWALQAFTRGGFDPSRHPISLLSLGPLGWIQIANFVVTGALFIACARGLRRVLRSGPASTWAPRLVGALGAGMIVAGSFVTDAGAGFPAGAPDGTPEMTWHGALHEAGYLIALLSWAAACFVLRRRFVADGQRGWARACVAVVVAVLALSSWPDADSYAIVVVIATAVQLGFVAAVAASYARDADNSSSQTAAEQDVGSDQPVLSGAGSRLRRF